MGKGSGAGKLLRLTSPLLQWDEGEHEITINKYKYPTLEDRAMRRTMTAMLAGLLLLPAFSAADKPATPGEQLEALKKEVEKSRKEFFQAVEKAKADKERQELRDKNNKQINACARRALELARKHPEDPVAVDALSWIITGKLGWLVAGDTIFSQQMEEVLDLLRKDYVTSDKLHRLCFHASIYDEVSTKPEQFLRALHAKSPHREIQGWACFFLGNILRSHAAEAKRWREIKDNPAEIKKMESRLNAEVVNRIKTGDPDKSLQEAEKIFERVLSDYGDIKNPSGQTLGDFAKATLFEMRHLAVGKVAPEVEGEDIDGKRFKLSDYRGKVVVLDFWGHW